ncbi:unnamed protein product [Prunus armeniaca]|uniref:Uncharacterized protein n=1 Tax=Prunus armeniaca TaxID=36596 RepID=A0A6J5USZ6_PRUAR|nr:unnamed protein product [Prunus armeniaca]CAB4310169.1 unnamed protein product [Prunus armeniaca]
MLSIDIIFLARLAELLFVVDLVRGSNLGGKIIVDEKLAVKKGGVGRPSRSRHFKVEMTPTHYKK